MEIQLWRSILCPYELAVRELEVKFNHIIDECKENDVYCPIEQVEGRVKSVSSILEKMQRKHILWREWKKSWRILPVFVLSASLRRI